METPHQRRLRIAKESIFGQARIEMYEEPEEAPPLMPHAPPELEVKRRGEEWTPESTFGDVIDKLEPREEPMSPEQWLEEVAVSYMEAGETPPRTVGQMLDRIQSEYLENWLRTGLMEGISPMDDSLKSIIRAELERREEVEKQAVDGRPLELTKHQLVFPALRQYQADAVEAFMKRKKGTVVLPTGTGKTLVAFDVINKTGGRVAILVPTIKLMEQWRKWLTDSGARSVGAFYGEEKRHGHITIFLYQSAHKYIHALDAYNVLIFDEVHRAGAPIFSKILREVFSKDYALGLTATLADKKKEHAVIQSYMPVVYRMGIGEARGAGWVSPMKVIPIHAKMDSEEWSEYQTLTQRISNVARKLGGGDITEWAMKAAKGDYTAAAGLKAVSQRRQLLTVVKDKVPKVTSIIQEHRNDMVLLFSESIDSIINLEKHLKGLGIPAMAYHSKMTPAQRRRGIAGWGVSYNVLLSVRALEEGIDVPEVSVGIIMASGKTMRQLVQRIGRIIRPQPGKVAKIYVVYVPNTTEDKVYAGVENAIRRLK